MVTLSKSGAAVAKAREELLRQLELIGQTPVEPQALIGRVAQTEDRDAYRAALMSLLANGTVERSEGWTIKLSAEGTNS